VVARSIVADTHPSPQQDAALTLVCPARHRRARGAGRRQSAPPMRTHAASDGKGLLYPPKVHAILKRGGHDDTWVRVR
jgi:hypothetical protein